MGDAKRLVLRPIPRADADALVKRVHYSGKVVHNSQLHIGVFYDGALEGAMQFGPSLDKRKLIGLVADTPWNGFLELNRLAFTDRVPRNGESRALAVAMRLIREHAPHVQWVVSFADATQCGDGTIYRAAGFVLTGIRRNTTIWRAPHEYAKIVNRITVTQGRAASLVDGGASMRTYKAAGFTPLPGWQLRYVYFIHPTARARLTVPVIPFSEINRRGIGMYRGTPRAGSIGSDAPAIHAGEGGATPTPALHEDHHGTSVQVHA